jgi:hypothetical protein
MSTTTAGVSKSSNVPFLNIVDPEFDFNAPEVVEAQAKSWYAESPFGLLVLRYARRTRCCGTSGSTTTASVTWR